MPDIIRFTYRHKKYNRTLHKHGIDFEKVKCLFYLDSSQAIVVHDEEHSIYEERFMVIGYVPDYNNFVRVNYTITKDFKTRLITARKASKKEVKYYFREHR